MWYAIVAFVTGLAAFFYKLFLDNKLLKDQVARSKAEAQMATDNSKIAEETKRVNETIVDFEHARDEFNAKYGKGE